MNPIRSALRNRSVVLVLTGFAVLLGIGALITMPRREESMIPDCTRGSRRRRLRVWSPRQGTSLTQPAEDEG